MPASKKSERAPGRPEQLSIRQLRQAALRLADRDGASNLAVRGVARECGVTPMALYRHVANLHELQDLVVDEALSGVLDDEVSGSWRERTLEMMQRVRGRLLSHPGAAEIFNARAVPVPAVIRISDWFLGVLEEAGFRGEEVVYAFDVLSIFTQGSVLFELTRSSAARLSLLDGSSNDASHLHKYRGAFAERNGEVNFRLGAEALLDGLEQRLRGRA